MIFSVKCYSRTLVQIALVVLTLYAPRVGGDQGIVEVLDRLPTSSESVSGKTVRPVRTYVQWKDVKYAIDPGIDIVMNVVRNPRESAQERESALVQLAMLMGQLHGHTCLDELGTIYDSAEELQKQLILTCFKGSRDPRGIPVFVRTLNKENNIKLRLSAAASLAQWNIHRGVAELVDLIDSEEMLPPPAGRLPYVRDNALQTFRSKNTHKGWGFPEENIRNSIYGRADLDDDQKRTKYNEDVRVEIKKWFVKNEHRFPEWKAGDPLPKIEQKNKSD